MSYIVRDFQHQSNFLILQFFTLGVSHCWGLNLFNSHEIFTVFGPAPAIMGRNCLIWTQEQNKKSNIGDVSN